MYVSDVTTAENMWLRAMQLAICILECFRHAKSVKHMGLRTASALSAVQKEFSHAFVQVPGRKSIAMMSCHRIRDLMCPSFIERGYDEFQ